MWVRTGRVRVRVERDDEVMELLIRRPTVGEVDAWQSLITGHGSMREIQARVNAWLGSLYLGCDGVIDDSGDRVVLSWEDVEGELTGTEIARAAMEVASLHVFDPGQLGKSSATPRS